MTLLFVQVAGQWNLGLYVCLVWTGSDVVLSTTSIMHLCAIALYRYNGIAHPLRVRSTQNARHVIALVAPAWTIAFTLSVPFAVQGILDTSHVLVRQTLDVPLPFPHPRADIGTTTSNPAVSGRPLDMYTTEVAYSCGLFNRSFAVYSSLVSFFIPLAVMVFADIRSIQILRKNIKLSLIGSSTTNSPRRNDVIGSTTTSSRWNDVTASSSAIEESSDRSFGRKIWRFGEDGRRWRSRQTDDEVLGVGREDGPFDPETSDNVRDSVRRSGLSADARSPGDHVEPSSSSRQFSRHNLAPASTEVGGSPVSSMSYLNISPCRRGTRHSSASAPASAILRRSGPTSTDCADVSEDNPSRYVSDVSQCSVVYGGGHDEGGEEEEENGDVYEEAETCLQSTPVVQPSFSSQTRRPPAPRLGMRSAGASTSSSSQSYVYRGRSHSRSVIYISMLTSGGGSVKVYCF